MKAIQDLQVESRGVVVAIDLPTNYSKAPPSAGLFIATGNPLNSGHQLMTLDS